MHRDLPCFNTIGFSDVRHVIIHPGPNSQAAEELPEHKVKWNNPRKQLNCAIFNATKLLSFLKSQAMKLRVPANHPLPKQVPNMPWLCRIMHRYKACRRPSWWPVIQFGKERTMERRRDPGCANTCKRECGVATFNPRCPGHSIGRIERCAWDES